MLGLTDAPSSAPPSAPTAQQISDLTALVTARILYEQKTRRMLRALAKNMSTVGQLNLIPLELQQDMNRND